MIEQGGQLTNAIERNIPKTIRILMVCLMVAGILNIIGIKGRQAQQYIFTLGTMVVLGLLARNIWITLFIWWTVFLYCFFKFQTGDIYVSNIFYGFLLYYLVKISFKRKHVDFFINAILWFVFANILYMVLQISRYDFIYTHTQWLQGVARYIENIKPTGFMGQISIMGCLTAFAVPLLASRGTKWAYVGSLGLFIPLYLSQASLCVLMGIVGLLWVLFFRLPRKVWIVLIIVLLIGGIFYIQYVDVPNMARLVLWKVVLKDCMIHPITGWGLDSFGRILTDKPYLYRAVIKSYKTTNIMTINWWGNPHNLYISLIYEFGFLSLFLLGGYLRQCALWFKNAIKDRNTIALAGFLIVFFGVSFGHFPLWLARFSPIIVPLAGLYEVQVRG